MLRFGIVSSSAQSPMPIAADNLPRRTICPEYTETNWAACFSTLSLKRGVDSAKHVTGDGMEEGQDLIELLIP